jgi:beta-galactosidase
MNHHSSRLVHCARLASAALALAAATISLAAQESPRHRISLDANWRFTQGDPAEVGGKLAYPQVKAWVMETGTGLSKNAAVTTAPEGEPGGGDISYADPGFKDTGWREVTLPHDWGVEGAFKQEYPGDTGKLPWFGVGWYRRHFTLAPVALGKKYYLDVDGAMAYSMVWLNGHFVGGWPYGYASWELDLTPFLKAGENVLAIRLDNPPDSSRWYPGGGIDRNVWLVETEPTHVAHWGVVVTMPEISADTATVNVSVTVDNPTPAAPLTVTSRIFGSGSNGQLAGAAIATSNEAVVPASTSGTSGIDVINTQVKIANPTLWGLDHPYLYYAVTEVTQGKKLVDRTVTPFGIRTAKFDPEHGFFLNGQHVMLNGVCDHSDLGALGSAINTRGLQRQLELLKEMGCNAIRTSHNPPSPELLDLCDRMGFLVMDEFADCWEIPKRPNGYNLLYDDWHEKDLRALVRRDRNHPSVIMWSVGNEIPEQSRHQGPGMAAELSAIVHEEDPTRPTTFACSDINGGYNGYQNGVDVFGYNYKPGEYAKFHNAHPEIPLFGSETASTISSRGEYFFPVTANKADGNVNFQVSSYDLAAPRWANLPDWEFKGLDENPFVAGEFVWTGFDYIGEPTPYNTDRKKLPDFTDPALKAKAEDELKTTGKVLVPSRSSYFGILDLAGFKKDRFYLYQSRWRPELPMAHILPHWNWPERVGQVTPVHVYTSGDEAELFLNGKSLGRKKKGQFEYRLRWDDVVYQPGELKVIAYKDGKQWAEDVVKTTGPAAKIKLAADRAKIKADGQDLSYVTVTIADQSGLMVPRSHNLVEFGITGPGQIVAVDNGDATSLAPFHAKQVKAFNGLALVIVRAIAGHPGKIMLHAKSQGLAAADVALEGR